MIKPFSRIILPLILALLTACGSQDSSVRKESEERANGPAIEKVTERGAVKVTVTVDKENPTIADRIRLELKVERDEQYEVGLPRFGEKLDQFGITDFDDLSEELVGDGRILSGRAYELEPFLSGEYTIPPMQVEFWKAGEEDRHQIETEEIRIKVSSVLEGTGVRTNIHDIVGPMEVPPPPSAFKWWHGLLLLAVATGAVWFFMAYNSEKAIAKAPPVPAHVIAFQRLKELGEAGYAEKGEFKLFFQELSDILRGYIEGRYGLRATDQTTEEFLHAIRESSHFGPEQQQTLKDFMKLSDLVKFAEHQPGDEDIQSAFTHCREFIVATQETPEQSGTARN